MASNVVPNTFLEALAADYHEEFVADSKPNPRNNFANRNTDNQAPSNKTEGTYDLEAFMLRHFPDASGPTPYAGGGKIWVLSDCFYRPGDGQTMFVIRHLNGSISAGCQHATCPGSKSTGNHWKELREHFEGSNDSRQFTVNANLDKELSTLPRTEYGLAERFRKRFGDHCRYIESWGGKWLVFNGQRWELSDCAAEIYAQETIHSIRREAWHLKDDDNDREESNSSKEEENGESEQRSSSVGNGMPEVESDTEST